MHHHGGACTAGFEHSPSMTPQPTPCLPATWVPEKLTTPACIANPSTCEWPRGPAAVVLCAAYSQSARRDGSARSCVVIL